MSNKNHTLISFLKRFPVPKQLSSLRSKLILAFFVPIFFLILMGVSSYKTVTTGIEDKFRETAIQVVGQTAEYIDFGLETVDNTSQVYVSDKNIAKYFTYSFIDASPEMFQLMSTIQNEFEVKSKVDDFVQNIYIIPEKGTSISSKSSFTANGETYKKILGSDTGKLLNENKANYIWSGSDSSIDETLAASNSDYALRLIRKFQNYQAILVIDVKADTIRQIIEKTELSKSGIMAFVTKDGKEITSNNHNDFLFSNQTFYKNAFESDDIKGTEMVSLNGQSYMFLYSKVGQTGAMICTLIPKTAIASQAHHIQNMTILNVIVACIIAISIAIFISTGIDKTIKRIISGLRLAAEGDLTVEFSTNRNDEFRTLTEEIQHTFSNMKELIKQVNLLSTEVAESAVDLNQTSEAFLKSSEDISRAMSEIEQGVTQEALDAEECLLQMDELSKKLVQVSEHTRQIGTIADKTKKVIAEGTYSTQELNDQTQSTIEITTDIINAIETLAKKSEAITRITNVINDIANKTNLLSFNAAIEAARSGEHGRSFAVVANEIRNLAEKSKESVNEIQGITNSILNDTIAAVKTAKKAEAVLSLQEDAVKNTTNSYEKINESVEQLVIYLNNISESVDTIEESRAYTLGAIENISAVLEEISASTETVSQTTTEQLSSVEELTKSAGTLKEDASELSKAIKKFKV